MLKGVDARERKLGVDGSELNVPAAQILPNLRRVRGVSLSYRAALGGERAISLLAGRYARCLCFSLGLTLLARRRPHIKIGLHVLAIRGTFPLSMSLST